MLDDISHDAGLVQHLIDQAQSWGSTLVIPVDLHFGEGLREAAFRAAALNAIRDSSFPAELATARSFRSLSAIHEGTAAEIDRLVTVLGIRKDAEQLKTVLARKKRAGKDWVSFFGIDIRRGHLAKERRVAPRSLALSGHHKAIWSLRPFDFDLETRERLLDSCPACQRKLGWSRTFGVSFCDKCPSADNPQEGGTDLRDFPQPFVEVDDVESLTFVTKLINPSSSDVRPKVHPDFSEFAHSEMFQFAVEIANSLDGNSPGLGKALQPTSLAKAGRAIIDWPKAFDDLVDEGAFSSQTNRTIPGLHPGGRLPHSLRTLLKERYNEKLRRGALRKVRGDKDVNDHIPTAPQRRLGHCRAELRRLAAGSNEVTPIEAAATILRASPIARLLASTLGLPIPHLLDLFAAGFLPELEPVLAGLRVAPRSVLKDSLFCSLHQVAKNQHYRPDGFPIWHTAHMLSNLNGAQWVAIFSALLDGTFPVWLSSPKNAVVRWLSNDIEALARALRPNTQGCPSDFVPLTQIEISFILGKSRTTVATLTSSGVIARNATGFDLAKLRKDWIFTTEARDLARLNGRRDLLKMQQILVKANVPQFPSTKVCLWSRGDVMRLFE